MPPACWRDEALGKVPKGNQRKDLEALWINAFRSVMKRGAAALAGGSAAHHAVLGLASSPFHR